MPSFSKGPGLRTPFGRNNYLRSTQDVKLESYTVAAASIPAETIDGATDQKILQPGTVMAKIISGGDAGKIGPFQRGTGAAGAAAVNEVQEFDLGAASAGTFTITFDGQTTDPIAYNATAAAVLAALQGLSNINPGDVTTGGGALPATPVTLTFAGQYAGVNVPQITIDGALTTGETITIATTTQGSPAGTWVGAASDGRGDPANIVGLCNTFLPWQLMERDVEIAVAYECTAVQAWCFELDAAGLRIALTNTTADLMRGTKGLDIMFK